MSNLRSSMLHLSGQDCLQGILSYTAWRTFIDEKAFIFIGIAGGLVGCLVLYGVMQVGIQIYKMRAILCTAVL